MIRIRYMLLATKTLVATLYLPIFSGLFLIGAMFLNAPFRYLNGKCTNIETCLLNRITLEIQQEGFWHFILAMWACGFLVVLIQMWIVWKRR